MPVEPNKDDWEARRKGAKTVYVCRHCMDNIERPAYHVPAHEQSDSHQVMVRGARARAAHEASAIPPMTPSGEPTGPAVSAIRDDVIVEDIWRTLLASASDDPGLPLYPQNHPLLPPTAPPLQHTPSPVTGIDWGVFPSSSNATAEQDPMKQAFANIARTTMAILNNEDVDFTPEDELLGVEDDNVSDMYEAVDGGPSKRPRNFQTDTKTAREWFPWQDKLTCTFDVLMHLHRSVFSERQLELLQFALSMNDVANIPTTRAMKSMNQALQKLCGIPTAPYTGVLGNRYYMNDLGQILAQEMANPHVRPHLSFYPEDAGQRLQEARQGAKWLHELPSSQTTPMVRTSMGDFFIYEPTMLKTNTMCVPYRWFSRGGIVHGWGWRLDPITRATDGATGWRLRQDITLEFADTQLMLSYPTLLNDYTKLNIPNPSVIFDRTPGKAGSLHGDWDYTRPGNPWRARAHGRRVVSLPLWMYCDDTSGNVSKKWNEHNSFLFTLAGLPREYSSKEYNIHFLCTSNQAPPLEMMGGVVEQLNKAQETGIWAWDCLLQEPVLLFPTILALLGDNPMQSEFACHIGLQGKCFCRSCGVKTADTADMIPMAGAPASQHDVSEDEDAASVNTEDSDSPPSKKPSRQKKYETPDVMFQRLLNFMKVGELRTKSKSIAILQGYTKTASQLNTKTKLAKERTNTGIKDTIQEFFLERLFRSHKKAKTREAKEVALRDAVHALPSDINSAVWKITGLDPHQDTPVEALHVVLLGFVKYFWRDLVQNQLNDTQKEILVQRLCACNLSGLGLSGKLNGQTLVQYAGSLVGRDFRALVQCAPFCIHDLVEADCFAAWDALSRLVPLIYQPVIDDLNTFLVQLDAHIHYFLACTAKWTCQWFNKPKFHILVHLPEHIRRFGPAILFATESFESFNTVIRAKSVHSNRQAPSRDIGHAFAQANRIRHLLSGGFFPSKSDVMVEEAGPLSYSTTPAEMKHCGVGPLVLIASHKTVASYLGLQEIQCASKKPGLCTSDKGEARHLSRCLTGKYAPHVVERFPPQSLFTTKLDIVLDDKEKCSLGQFVVFHYPQALAPFVGSVQEILVLQGHEGDAHNEVAGILIQVMDVPAFDQKFNLPELKPSQNWAFVSYKEILCIANVQHNCARHGCSATGSAPVRQEREDTERRTAVIEHRGPLSDLLLNCYQMRSSRYLHQLRPPLPGVDAVGIVHSWVKRQDEKRKAQARTSAAVAVPKAMAMGNGVEALTHASGSHGSPAASTDQMSLRRGRSASRSSAPTLPTGPRLQMPTPRLPSPASVHRGRGRGRGHGSSRGVPKS